MLLSRRREGAALPHLFSSVRLAAWLAIVLVLSKALSLERTRDFWWLRDLSMASFGDVLFALGLGLVAESRLANCRSRHLHGFRPADRLRSNLRPLRFYSVVAAGVFNYFGRPLSYDLLKLVHGLVPWSRRSAVGLHCRWH